MDYEKILESLKICSEVGTSCEGCSGRGERHCIANLTKAAAIAIETLLHALDMARRERDVVAKRMVELEQETVTNRNGLNEPLTLDELREMDEEAAELAQAALKLRRAYTGINPTPVTRRAAYNALLEELADVYVCVHAMRLDDCETLSMVQRMANEKMARWAARLEDKSDHG